MKRELVTINGREYPVIRDAVKIGNWEEVEKIPVSKITKRDEDTEKLDGIIIRGYEMEWGKVNENFELYEKDAFDDFIQSYFVEKGFNLPVDIEHAGHNPEWLAGRIIYAEVNTRGFYYVAYIPRTYKNYDIVLNMLREGILQGFSKFGYATDWQWVYDEDGYFKHEIIKKFKLIAMSVVSMPANGIQFEKMQETKQNGLVFKNTTIKELKQDAPTDELGRIFN